MAEPAYFCRFDDPVSLERAARLQDEDELPSVHTMVAAAVLVAAAVYAAWRRIRRN